MALSRVTDEFIAHIKAAGPDWDLDQTSQFLVVAATLLDLKAARLLPAGDIEDPEDLALLEARDLLFARLLQYRAYKQVAGLARGTLEEQGRRFPRDVGVEPRFARLLPEVTITIGLDRFAALAARALAPKQADVISLAHLHAPAVSVRDQAVADRRPAAPGPDADLPRADRRLAGPGHHGRPVPGPAGAVPGGRGGVRAADRPRRADHPLDRAPTPASWTSPTSSTPPKASALDEPRVVRTSAAPTMRSPGSDKSVSGALEALLLLAAEPMSVTELAQAVGVPEAEVAEALAELVAFYDETGRGFELRELGGGWRYYTREEYADLVSRYVLEGQQARLSQAALETLAVVAYSQPISRGRVSAVRGVNVDGVIRTLLARGLIEEAGPRPRLRGGGVRHHQLLPGADGAAVAGRAAGAGAAPARGEELEAELGQLAEVARARERRSRASSPSPSTERARR